MYKYDLKYKLVFSINELIRQLLNILTGIFSAIIPINRKKIVFSSHQGRCGISCNLKYIVREIIKQNLPYELVWISKKENFKKEEGFEQVKFVNIEDSLKVIKELTSAKIWLNNCYFLDEYKLGINKKKNQFYINTWHGSLGIKKMFYDAAKLPCESFLKLFKKDFDNCDLMLSNSIWENNVYRSALRYRGKIFITGHPRNDIFFEDNKKYKEKIYSKLNIGSDKKIALWAPTFRQFFDETNFALNYDNLKNALEKRFGGLWVVVSRFHPTNLANINSALKRHFSDKDASYYPDIQELLVASEVLISDFSSCMFDMVIAKKPCFVYANDIESYNCERGFYYPLEEAPMPIAVNNEELEKNILNFDMENYLQKCDKFLRCKQVLEDGRASKRAVRIIKRVMKNG